MRDSYGTYDGRNEEPPYNQDCQHETDLQIIERFWQQVCARAESKMLAKQKLEGAHYAAATEILAEMRRAAE